MHELNMIHNRYIGEIKSIKNFLTEIHKKIQQPVKTKGKSLSDEDRLNVEKFIKYLDKHFSGKSLNGEPFIIKPRKAYIFLNSLAKEIFHTRYLVEMTLVYLQSFYEAFIKDYLKAVLILRNEILCSKKTLTFEEIVSFKSLDDLIAYMAEKEVEGLAYASIDDVAKYFDQKFNITLSSDFQKWQIVREASYRRNILVHNQGITNKIYCEKTGHGKIGEKLDIDIDYVITACDATRSLMDFIHTNIKKKISFEKPVRPEE